MKLVEIKCGKCGATLQVNAELPKCICQYCGNEIALVNTANNVQAAAMQTNTMDGQTVPDDPNEVTKYRNMLKMTMIVAIIIFIARLIFRRSILFSFAAVFLCTLPVTDAGKMMKNREMMQRHGMQKGNIIGVTVLSWVDMLLWAGLFVSQFASLLK